MFVATRMTKHPLTVEPSATLNEAAKIMKTNHFHRLPVVENGKLLEFDEIMKVYEKSQLEALNQSSMFDSMLTMTEEGAKESEIPHYSFKIDDITLRYTRITEEKEFERALLVPVWSFSGTCYADGKAVTEGSFLEINAVDGTVYNSMIGN